MSNGLGQVLVFGSSAREHNAQIEDNPPAQGPSRKWGSVSKGCGAWPRACWTLLSSKHSLAEGPPAAAEKGWLRGSMSCMDPALALCFWKIMMMNEMTNELW